METFEPLVTIPLKRYDKLLALEQRTEQEKKKEVLGIIDGLLALVNTYPRKDPVQYLEALRKAWSL